MACAENRSGSLPDDAGDACVCSRIERKLELDVDGGMSTGVPAGRGAGPGRMPGVCWMLLMSFGSIDL
jgi:hypothetical protein